MYSDLMFNIAVSMSFVMAIYFFIVLCFSKGYRIHSIIIVLYCLVGIYMPESNFIKETSTAILIDGVTAFTLTMFLFLDRLAWKQALLLAFATVCHIMIIYDLTIASTWFSVFFYNYYDELIITVGLIQMAVSYNGINTAFRNIWELIHGCSFHCGSYSQSYTAPKIREKSS